MGVYALGKCQRVIKLLRAAGYDKRIWLHGGLASLCTLYQQNGIDLGDVALVSDAILETFKGQVVLCPPAVYLETVGAAVAAQDASAFFLDELGRVVIARRGTLIVARGETITVTGATPVVDVQNAAQQRVLTKDVVDAIPSGRTHFGVAALIVACQAVIYTYDGWYAVIYFGEEVRNPGRDVPRAMIGGVLAVIIVLGFLRDWRATFISALALPTSVIATVWFINLLGFTFNMMSLMALSLVIGILIDDAVVVRESMGGPGHGTDLGRCHKAPPGQGFAAYFRAAPVLDGGRAWVHSPAFSRLFPDFPCPLARGFSPG